MHLTLSQFRQLLTYGRPEFYNYDLSSYPWLVEQLLPYTDEQLAEHNLKLVFNEITMWDKSKPAAKIPILWLLDEWQKKEDKEKKREQVQQLPSLKAMQDNAVKILIGQGMDPKMALYISQTLTIDQLQKHYANKNTQQ